MSEDVKYDWSDDAPPDQEELLEELDDPCPKCQGVLAKLETNDGQIFTACTNCEYVEDDT